MSARTSLGRHACAALALLAVLAVAETVLGQQQGQDPVSDEGPPSSVEQGQTQLDDSFDWRQGRPEKRRGALQDTKFELNLRTYYFDCHQFDGSVAEAWAIGGWDEFVSMSVAAGATAERGVFAAGGQYEKGNFSIGAIDYYSADMINIGYAETNLELALSSDWRPKLAAQVVDQHSVGRDLLQGDSFSAWQFGLKAELPVKQALFTVAFTHAGGNANLRDPWSGYPGYTAVQVEDFDRAGENAFLLRAGYKFPWVEGLSAYALGVFGTTPDLAGEYRRNEYDFNLQWVPPKGVLKGLSLRVRYALVHQYGGDVDNLTEFRAICNYAINF